ncbi:MAG: glycosyltransferase N-terminal domain-containing protein [Cardiobacteriaceae bacterium]|nr:glycosyltransferase N-terminal domain-containing protein [Cardiobacteriaceae bacterium]
MNSTHPHAPSQAALPWYYAPLLALLLPLAILRLLWKSRNNPAYRKHIAERLARQPPAALPDTLWVHTVSVGEFLAIRPLLAAYLQANPAHTLWITTTTPTGRAQTARFQREHRERVRISYLPYDLPALMRRFIRHVRPRAIVLMETEIWPALITEAARHNIPVLLTNARLSARSLRRYRRFAQRLLAPLLDSLAINAQTRDDARRFRHLGFRRITVTPSLKYLPPQPAAPAALAHNRHPVILAASTHEGEEAVILAAFKTLQQRHPQATLLIAPRHPERREAVSQYIRHAGYTPRLRSQNDIAQHANDVYLIDTLGELPAFFAAADLAFIGGTLIERGGHNLLEPLHARIPVLYGPSTYNFAHIARELARQPFAQQVQNADELAAAMQTLLERDRAALQQAIDHYLAPYRQLLSQHLHILNTISHRKDKNSIFLS